MKRILSVITMLAVMLAMVVPTAVLADEIANFANVGSVALSYMVTNAAGTEITEAHPGDSVTIHAYATLTGETAQTMSAITMTLPYNAEQLTPADLPTDKSIIIKNGGLFYTEESSRTLEPGVKQEIFSHTFTVNETATGTATVGSVTSTEKPTNGFYDCFTIASVNEAYVGYLSNLTATSTAFEIKPNTITVTIDGQPINNGTTYYANSVSLVVDGTNFKSATLSKEGASDVTFAKGVAQTVSGVGTYTLTVVVADRTEPYTFTLHAPVSAQIDNTIQASAKGYYEHGDAVIIPVKITGLGDAKAAMVSFGVTYDDTVFENLTWGNTDDVKLVDGKYVYGDLTAEKPLSNGDPITTFTLKVKDTAAFGNTTITFDGADFALYTEGRPPKPSETNLAAGIAKENQVVTIAPTAEQAATITLPSASDPWVKDSRTITVAPATGVTLGYAPLDSEPTDLATAFKNATKVGTDNKLTANVEKNHYVIAKVGEDPNAVYILVDTLTPRDLKLDQTKPTITLTGDYSGWKQKLEIAENAITAKDDLSDVDSIQYCLDAENPDWKPLTNAGIVIDTDWEKTIQIKVTDNAGNFKTEDIPVKVDATRPVVDNIIVGEEIGVNGKTITFRASDALSGLYVEAEGNKVQASIYHSPTQADLDTITAIEELDKVKTVDLQATEDSKVYNGSYDTKNAGTYYIVVKDKAGNQWFGKASVKFDDLQEASKLQVKTVQSDTAFHEGFLPDGSDFKVTDETGNPINHNGWFTYVAVQAAPREDDYVNTLEYKKAGEETYTAISDGYEFKTEGTYTVKITTTHKNLETDTESAEYTFAIVPVSGIHATTGFNFYSIQDYARIKRFDTLNAASGANLNDSTHKFWGGMFSGDVTGDLAVTSADLKPIIDSLRNGEDTGEQKTIPIMNLPQ